MWQTERESKIAKQYGLETLEMSPSDFDLLTLENRIAIRKLLKPDLFVRGPVGGEYDFQLVEFDESISGWKIDGLKDMDFLDVNSATECVREMIEIYAIEEFLSDPWIKQRDCGDFWRLGDFQREKLIARGLERYQREQQDETMMFRPRQ